MHETGRIPNVATVADRLAIRDTLARRPRGVDRGDSASFGSLARGARAVDDPLYEHLA